MNRADDGRELDYFSRIGPNVTSQGMCHSHSGHYRRHYPRRWSLMPREPCPSRFYVYEWHPSKYLGCSPIDMSENQTTNIINPRPTQNQRNQWHQPTHKGFLEPADQQHFSYWGGFVLMCNPLRSLPERENSVGLMDCLGDEVIYVPARRFTRRHDPR